MPWQGSTPWIKSTFMVLILANVFNLAGFVTPGWMRKYVRGGGTTDFGLWLICYEEAMGCVSAVGREILGDWYRACQALITCGLISMWISLAITMVYIYKPKIKHTRSRPTAYAIVISCTLSSFFMLVGVIIYGQKAMEAMRIANASAVLFYSFGFATTATVLCGICAILTIGDIREILPDDL